MAALADIKPRLEACNQEHLLKFWNEIDDKQREHLLEQLPTIKFEEVNNLFASANATIEEDVQHLDDRMQPIPPEQFESEVTVNEETIRKYRETGLKAVSEGQVGVLLLAGGQGTRIGVGYPKGMYSVGLPSKKTLFQLQAERIRKVQNLAEQQTGKKGNINWYIMTSKATNKMTEEYLKENNYFGLNRKNVLLFNQGLLPCFDFNGKILLEEKNCVAMSPDGNGGVYRALKENKILDDMQRQGIKYIHAHSVDNILVKVADPVFIGYCVQKGADCGAKVVSKSEPQEAVGVVCLVDGKFQVVEYSEISEQIASLRDSQGELVFRAGNICNHFFTAEFLQKVGKTYDKQLKLHVAKKKIPYVDESGTKVKPTSPNGIKIEKFIFDVFQFTNNFVTWDVPRITEFSALKNSDDAGKDCPSTARRDLLTLHKKYIEDAGGIVKCDTVEIPPLLSYAGEGLEKIVKGKLYDKPSVLSVESKVSNGFTNGIINGNGILNGNH